MCIRDSPSIGRSILDNDEAARAVSPGNRASTGSVSITIVGTLLATADYTAMARIENTACEASVWESATSLACRVAGGSRATMRLSVTAGVIAGTTSESVSYDAPSLSSFLSSRYNRATTGSTSFTV